MGTQSTRAKVDPDMAFPLPLWFLILTFFLYPYKRIVNAMRYRFFLSYRNTMARQESSLPKFPIAPHTPLVIGHRGCRGKHPENSRQAFDHALEWADGFELDTQLSSDGIPIVLHDDTLDRTTNAVGPVNAKPWSELSQILLENREPVPSLEEVLQRYGKKTLINIEIKKESSPQETKKSAQAVSELISRTSTLEPRYLVSSFSPLALYYIRKFCPRVPRAQLIADPVSSRVQGLRKYLLSSEVFGIAWGASAFVLEKSIPLQNPQIVKRFHSHGGEVWIYTSNSPEEWKTLTSMGIDAIITDIPDEARKNFS